MAASVDDFLVRFPEFESSPAGTIAAVLAAVEARVDPEYSETAREEVIYFEIAETLAAATRGRNSRTDGKKSTIYGDKLRELKNIHALGRRLA